MTLAPEPQTWKEVRETDFVRLEQHLQDLSAQYLQRCAEMSLRDGKHAMMAKLYAGAKRLHQAVKEGAVADAIVEIGANLIGCEQMALIVARGKRNKVAFIGSAGLNRRQLDSMRMNARAIIEEACTGTIYMPSDGEEPDPFLSSLGITAFVPFWLDYTTKGAIVFFDLLPQRNGLDHDTSRAGLAVTTLYGATQTVIKPLPAIFKHIAGVSGSTILGNGRVALILDIPALFRDFRLQAAHAN